MSIAELWRAVSAAIDGAVAERTRRPPVPVAVTWRERRVASIDLGAPLLAVAAVDVDGDGRSELAALTSRDLILLGPAGQGMRELGRAALPGEPAAIRPRDAVGTLVVDARAAPIEILARSSERAEAVALVWSGGVLRESRRLPGFPLCPELRAELAPGRNYFEAATARWDEGAVARTEPPATFFGAVCRADLRDPTGRPMWVTAIVDTERVVRLRCAAAQGECPPGPTQGGEYAGVGVAVEVADIDNDGRPEVLTTRGGAPGDRDRVSIYSRRGEQTSRIYAKEFSAGVVGVVASDLDGDGDRDVLVAVRFAGSNHVSFWTLN
ncbi:MAG TPA: VCBS repeat-containing protein [Kofleriaceae bacterium]|nr:VCBS repeat-containing protein [Kofleriaceae bacterium]